MTNYDIDTTYDYLFDEREKYQIVHKIGNTIERHSETTNTEFHMDDDCEPP
jgi:hypothetical protein